VWRANPEPVPAQRKGGACRDELLPESWTENSVLTYGEQFYVQEQFVI